MGSSKNQRLIPETEEAVELQTENGTLRFQSQSALDDYAGSTAAPAEKVPKRMIAGCDETANAKIPAERLHDVVAMGARSVEQIDDLIKQLLDARDYLLAEGERVRLVNARYSNLAQTASASAKIIADSIGQWRDTSHAHSPNSIEDIQLRIGQSPSQD